MSTPVRCPKCKSDQFTAQKRGFSGGKAAVGAVLTGGIGTLAGFHGSDKIDVYCLSCGHKWDPVQQNRQDKATQQYARNQRLNRDLKQQRIWKRQFFKAYERGNLDEAETLIREKLRLRKLIENRGLDGAYKDLKRMHAISTLIKLLFVVLFIGLMLWILT